MIPVEQVESTGDDTPSAGGTVNAAIAAEAAAEAEKSPLADPLTDPLTDPFTEVPNTMLLKVLLQSETSPGKPGKPEQSAAGVPL